MSNRIDRRSSSWRENIISPRQKQYFAGLRSAVPTPLRRLSSASCWSQGSHQPNPTFSRHRLIYTSPALHRKHMALRHPSSALRVERASLLFVSPAALIPQSSRHRTLKPLSLQHSSTMHSHPRRKPSLSMSSTSHPFTAGDEIQGIVTRITNYGAFLQLPGGLSGLVHISEIADRFVKSVSDYVNVGDTVTVRVLSIDRERRKITLSRRQAMRSTGYDRVVELGGDWGHPWNDEGNTNYMQLSTTSPHTLPCHWEPDPSLFKPFDPPPSNDSNLGDET